MAMMPAGSNRVDNVIIVGPDGFEMEGFVMTEVQDAVICEPGMYHNPADGLFYFDAALTLLTRPDPA